MSWQRGEKPSGERSLAHVPPRALPSPAMATPTPTRSTVTIVVEGNPVATATLSVRTEYDDGLQHERGPVELPARLGLQVTDMLRDVIGAMLGT